MNGLELTNNINTKMKHVKLYEEFVNEDLGTVVDVAMGVAVGLMGLWALVQGAPAVSRVFGDTADYLAAKSEKKAKIALKNQRKEAIAPIIKKFEGDERLKQMYNDLPPYTDKAASARKRQLTTIGNYIKSKLTEEEMAYFRDISAMLRDGDLKESVLNEATYKSSDNQFIEEWVREELSKNGKLAIGDAAVEKAIDNIIEEWKEAASRFSTVRGYLMDLRKQGVFDELLESKINELAVTNAVSIKQILKNSFRFKKTPRGGMLGIPLANNNNDDIRSNSIAMQGIANLVNQLKNTEEMNVVSVLQPKATGIEFTVKTDTATYTVNLSAGPVRNSLVSDSSSFWMLLDSIKKSK